MSPDEFLALVAKLPPHVLHFKAGEFEVSLDSRAHPDHLSDHLSPRERKLADALGPEYDQAEMVEFLKSPFARLIKKQAPTAAQAEAAHEAARPAPPSDVDSLTAPGPLIFEEPGEAPDPAEQLMPFKSTAQRAFLYATNPKVAAEFQSATPKGAKLPRHVKKKPKKRRS